MNPTITPGGLLFSLFSLVWFAIAIVSFVMFIRGMIALTKIPERLERIEAAIARRDAGGVAHHV